MFKLNSKQLDRLSEIFANAGLVVLASLVLPYFTGTNINSSMILIGLGLSIISLIVSLVLLKNKKRK